MHLKSWPATLLHDHSAELFSATAKFIIIEMMTAYSRQVTIQNARGLHARAAAKFVKRASTFEAAITVTKDASSVDGTSIMGLLMLAASIGTHVTIDAEGPDAEQAVAALVALIEAKFDED